MSRLEQSESHKAFLALLMTTESNFERAASLRFEDEPRKRKALIKANTGSHSMTLSNLTERALDTQ